MDLKYLLKLFGEGNWENYMLWEFLQKFHQLGRFIIEAGNFARACLIFKESPNHHRYLLYYDFVTSSFSFPHITYRGDSHVLS